MKLPHFDRVRSWTGWGAAVGIRLSGWVVINALCVIGFIGFLAFALGGFTPEGFFAQTDNLANRYLEAPEDARLRFHAIAGVSLLVLYAVFGLLRFGSLTDVFLMREVPQ